MKSVKKRIGAILLSLAMIVTMLPVFSLTASAAGSLSVSDANIGLTWTDASNSSGKATWSASGTTITGTATGYKVLGILNRTITTKLTIKNNYAETRTLSFSYTLSGGGSVSGISGNAYSGELAAGGSLTITLTSPSGTSTNTLTITNIQLIGNSNVVTTFQPSEGGSYTVDGTAVTAEVSYEKEPAASSYAVVATPASGYSFFGWYNVGAGNYMSYDASTTLTVSSNATVKPVFVSGTPAHFGVGTGRYYDLSEAVAAAQAGSTKKIVVIKDGTVSGTHTIPAGVTLLVPYNDDYTTHGSNPSCTSYTDLLGGKGNIAWVSPTPYRTLTLAADAHITVNGILEVGGRHASGSGATGMYAGSPTDKLGYIHMQAGSHMDLNSGAFLYCWGYIYGDGTITAKNGSAIYENFQMQDFRGGDKSTELAQGFLVFPVSQYYVQNIEVATTYEYGSVEYVHTSVYMSRMEHGATVQFIGDNAMFRPQPGSYVVKDYDPVTDNLYLHTYGDCGLSELAMTLAGVDVNSKNFVLPITSNIQIAVHTGTATLMQNVMMLPGSSLTVDEGATLNIAYTDTTNDVVTAGGYALQIFDYDNFISGIDQDTFEVVDNRYYLHYGNTGKRRLKAVPYTCTTRKTRTEADLTDVTLDINGTVISNGFIYSTVTYADVVNEDYTITGGGANIISSNGTGVLEMVNGAGGDIFGIMYDQDCAEAVDKGGVAGDGVYYYIPLASAQLRNGDGSMLDTTYAEAGMVYEYCAEHDCWYTEVCLQCEPCYYEHTPGAEADCENAQVCTVCGEVLATATGHSYVGVVTDPTCTVAGFTTYTCSACGDSYVGDQTSALGHSYNGVVTAPDCNNGGFTTYTCSACGDSYEGDQTSALGHSYSAVVTDPTCGVAGKTVYTCSACGDSYEEEIPATGAHTYDNEFDVDCDVCGGIREVKLPIIHDGKSVSEDVSGLAFRFTLPVVGMSVDKTTAIYDGATLNGYKLVEMGANLSNGKSNIKLAVGYLCDLTDESASYAVRIINIPEANYDSEITAVPYFVVEIDGKLVTVEGEAQVSTYNGVLNR